MMEKEKTRGIAILGSTGSIGTQALDVIREQSDVLHVEVLTAGRNADLLISQAIEFKPNAVVIAESSLREKVYDALSSLDIKVYSGAESLEQVVEMEGIDMVLTGLVGAAGLRPTLSAIRSGKHIALANKETMVVAGELVTAEAAKAGVLIHPVDSEHSAIYQCLAGEFGNPIPFRGFNESQLATVTKSQALKHPNWTMGAKITIDSASMMNKGLEVIEAKWLFDINVDQIEIIVHPQSIIHSIVQFEDGSMKAQMGLPDMKLPIQYALTYPRRLKNNFPRFNFLDYPELTFEQPDFKAFRNLQLAFTALQKGGNSPAILNAANEVAVARFLNDEIKFAELPSVVEHALAKVSFDFRPDLAGLIAADAEARAIASEY